MVVDAVSSLTNSRKTAGLLPRKRRLNDTISSNQTKDWSLEGASSWQQPQKGLFLDKKKHCRAAWNGECSQRACPQPSYEVSNIQAEAHRGRQARLSLFSHRCLLLAYSLFSVPFSSSRRDNTLFLSRTRKWMQMFVLSVCLVLRLLFFKMEGRTRKDRA